MTSKENADHLVTQGLDHIMALQGPQQVTFRQAQTFAEGARLPAALTEEQLNGQRVIRTLYRFSVEGLHRWGHLREIWHVKQTTIDSKKRRENPTSLAP